MKMNLFDQNQKFVKYRESGFTLLEAIAVIAIISILSVVSVSSGLNFWASLQLENAQSNLYGALRTARSNSQSSLGGFSREIIIDPLDPSVVLIRSIDLQGIVQVESRVEIPNLVTITLNNPIIFDSRGEASLGTFVLTSTVNDGQSRCVTVSTLIGSIRKSC